jgi:CubicO group peptidase (beta-lactamase class C family)
MPLGVNAMRNLGLRTVPDRWRRRALLALATALLLVASACDAETQAGSGDVGTVIEKSVEEQLAPLGEADQVRAIVAAQDGEVVYQRYTDTTPGEYHDVASVTKSVMSTLVGIAVADGLLSLDDTLAETLPEYAARMKSAVAKVTVRHLLTMTGGFPVLGSGDEYAIYDSRDWIAATLAAGTVRPRPRSTPISACTCSAAC